MIELSLTLCEKKMEFEARVRGLKKPLKTSKSVKKTSKTSNSGLFFRLPVK